MLKLFCDLSYNACAYGTAAFTDSETLAFFHSDWGDQFNFHFNVVAWHAHFSAFWQLDVAGYVGGSEEELWTIAVEEWGMTAAFIFGQYVYLSGEFGVWLYGAWFSEYLATNDVFTVDTTEQCADVIASHSLVKGLSEHFYAGYYGFGWFILQAYDFSCVANFNGTTFYSAGSYGATAGDGEYVFDWHQEWFIGVTFWGWDVVIYRLHQIADLLFIFSVAVESAESGANNDRGVIAWIVIGGEEISDFHFYEVDQFRIIYLVSFVQEYNDSRYTYLFSQEDVFTGLRHWAVSCGYYEDSAVHLSCTGDHVLYIVSVPWAVNVCIVTGSGFVFNGGGVDGNTTCCFFGCFID